MGLSAGSMQLCESAKRGRDRHCALSHFRMERNSSLKIVCTANATGPAGVFGLFERPCSDSRGRFPAEVILVRYRRGLWVHALVDVGRAEAGNCMKPLEGLVGYRLFSIRVDPHHSNFYPTHIPPQGISANFTYSVSITLFSPNSVMTISKNRKELETRAHRIFPRSSHCKPSCSIGRT